MKQAKYMWKLLNGFLPQSLTSNFNSNDRTQFSNSISRLVSLNRFILFAGPKVWEEIPESIRQKPTLNSFSKSLMTHYLNSL